MSDAEKDFQLLLCRVRRGDQNAVAELLQQYEREVRIVARTRLSTSLRPYLDSVDLVQSVHRSVMIGLRDDKFDISCPEKLLGLVLTIVRRKAARHWNRVRRLERPSVAGLQRSDISQWLLECNPSPSDPARVAQIKEAVEVTLEQLDEVDVALIKLRIAGYSTVDACRELGLNADSARARLSRTRQRLRRMQLDCLF